MHIETTSLADGIYELIQEPDEDFSEAQVNTVEITEVLNSDSEEPQHTDPINISTDATCFKLCNLLLFSCAFKLSELYENLSCIILDTYCLNTRTESE